jgi:hypothetical protein
MTDNGQRPEPQPALFLLRVSILEQLGTPLERYCGSAGDAITAGRRWQPPSGGASSRRSGALARGCWVRSGVNIPLLRRRSRHPPRR